MRLRGISLMVIGLVCLAACQGTPTTPTTPTEIKTKPKAKASASPSPSPSASTATSPKPSASVSPSASPSASPSVSPSPSPSASASASPSPSPSPSASATPDFFPVAEGQKRVMDVYNEGVKIGTLTFRIGTLTVESGVTTYTQVGVNEATTGNRDVFRTTVKKSATQVTTTDEGSTDVIPKLKFPVAIGTKWDGLSGDTYEVTEGPVAVTVPYGEVTGAFKVVHKAGASVLDTTWYAPALGEVKTEGGAFKSELKEFIASGTPALDETATAAAAADEAASDEEDLITNDEEATDEADASIEEELTEE